MENINLVDGLAIAILSLSAITAYFRGLAREILAIFSWVTAALVAFIIAPQIDPLINLIPIVNEILTDSCELSILISFTIGFIFVLIFLSLLIPILTNVIHRSSLNNLDRLLGLGFGTLRGFFIIILFSIGYDIFFNNSETSNALKTSKTVEIIFDIKEDLKNRIPDNKPEWLSGRFNNLMKSCTSNQNTTYLLQQKLFN